MEESAGSGRSGSEWTKLTVRIGGRRTSFCLRKRATPALRRFHVATNGTLLALGTGDSVVAHVVIQLRLDHWQNVEWLVTGIHVLWYDDWDVPSALYLLPNVGTPRTVGERFDLNSEKLRCDAEESILCATRRLVCNQKDTLLSWKCRHESFDEVTPKYLPEKYHSFSRIHMPRQRHPSRFLKCAEWPAMHGGYAQRKAEFLDSSFPVRSSTKHRLIISPLWENTVCIHSHLNRLNSLLFRGSKILYLDDAGSWNSWCTS